jgi:outer membrane protein
MMKKCIRLLLSAALLLLAPGVHFLAAVESLELSLESCIEQGLAHSRTLQNQLSALAAAGDAVREAKAGRLPRLTLSAAYTRLSEEEATAVELPVGSVVLAEPAVNSGAFSAGLTQPLFSGFRLDSGIRASEQAAVESRHLYRRARETLIFELRTAYWRLAGAGELEAVIRENLERVRAHWQDASERFGEGLVTYNDLLSVEMQLAESELLLIDGGIGRRVAEARLNTLLGNEPDRPLRLRYSLQGLPGRAGSVEEMTAAALSRRSDLLALISRGRSREAALQAVRSGWYPELFVTGSAAFARPNPRLFPPPERFEATWELGVGAVLQVGAWPSLPARIRRAEAALDQVRNSRADLTAAIRLQVIEKALDYDRRCQQTRVAEKMIRQAEENLRITGEKAAAGLALTSDLLDAEQALLEAGLRLTQSRIEARIAWAALRLAQGREPGATAAGEGEW